MKWTYAGMLLLLALATSTAAAQGRATLDLSPDGMWRFAMTVMTAMVIGYLRGIKKQIDANSERIETVKAGFEAQIRNTDGVIALMREVWPDKYYNKQQVDEMKASRDARAQEQRERLDEFQRVQQAEFRAINLRLDEIVRLAIIERNSHANH